MVPTLKRSDTSLCNILGEQGLFSLFYLLDALASHLAFYHRINMTQWQTKPMLDHSSDENIRNATRRYLSDNYPSILPCVPEDVLEFGLPDRAVTIVVVILLGILTVISVTGNSLMIFLYGR